MPKKTTRDPLEEYFAVEVILSTRRINEQIIDDPNSSGFGSGWEYLVKWAGYSNEQNSWQRIEDLRECKRLLCSFWEEIGLPFMLTNYRPFMISPRKEWIAREKKLFASQQPAHATPTQTDSTSKERASI
ncbi:hypothetical protein C8R44DRAFT_131652 [Mycena epipterygia]|nr:hypothetical protein C8R44DRAFT_131652 [Mycena epipterygia]